MFTSRNYLSAIETLNQLQTRTQGNAPRNGDKLKAMTKYLHRCGITLEKLDDLSVIHVTGTYGKGSTCVYTENVLRKHCYKTGFYSSPHLLEVRERIRLDGKPISKEAFAECFWKIYDMLDRLKEDDSDMPLYFPFLTIIAFHVFLENKVDVAIVEVGIGGEYDCTNFIRKTAVVGFAPINIDHTAILGASVESIAWHKSGVMKPGCAAFSVEQPEDALSVLLERSKERKCSLTVLRNDCCLIGAASKIPCHVRKTNATLAMALSKAFVEVNSRLNGDARDFSMEMAARAVETTFWPGRYHIKQVDGLRFFLEGAHTVESVKTASFWFRTETDADKKKALIFNLTGRRDANSFLIELLGCGFDLVLFIPNVGHDRNTADTTDFKLTTDTQLELCEQYRRKWCELAGNDDVDGKSFVFPSFAKARNFLDDGGEYDVLVTGSLYLVGAALSVLDPTLNGILSESDSL